MNLLPLLFTAAGAWNLFLLTRNLRRGYATVYFQRVTRDGSPGSFWMFSLLLGIAGLMLMFLAAWAARL
jgi:hypothetical protein